MGKKEEDVGAAEPGLPDVTENEMDAKALDDAFGPAEPIEDELLTSVDDVPLVEPIDARHHGHSSPAGLTRALWFFGIVVTALIGVQTVHLFIKVPASNEAPLATPPPSRSVSNDAPRDEAEQVDRLLNESRVQLSRGFYEQVLRVLEPLADEPQLLDANQRFESYLLLARAHRALGNVEKAQQWSLRATDQAVDRREPEQVFEEASALNEQARHADARHVLHQLLARADALPAKEAGYRLQAQIRVADTWWSEAQRSGAFAPLPGLDHVQGGAVAPHAPPAAAPHAAEGAKTGGHE